MLELLQKYLACNVETCENFDIDSDMVEAQLMAYLGTRFLEKLPSTFPQTTGVTSPTIAGKMALQQNY